jgi:sulfatase maturation enzyme AslB (radical SAM superfamily)
MEEFTYYFGELHKKGICKNIDLQIISNLTNLNEKFLAILPYFKSVRFSISVDAYGTANDYIRWPSKFHSIENNISKILGIDSIKVVEIHNALNILSLFNFKDFLYWTKKIEKMFENTDKNFVFVPLKVFEPMHYSPFIAPESLKQKFFADVKSFFDVENFGKFTKTKVEIMLLCKKLKDSITDPLQLDYLVKEIQRLDRERSVKIQDYIPDFDKHIQKSQ